MQFSFFQLFHKFEVLFNACDLSAARGCRLMTAFISNRGAGQQKLGRGLFDAVAKTAAGDTGCLKSAPSPILSAAAKRRAGA